jgi:hypothetical protein
MILKPWEKASRYQGHEAGLFRKTNWTRASTTRNERTIGSHHSCVFGEYEDAGKIKSGTS